MTRAVFSDFDGTITATETFADMLRTEAPGLAAELIPSMVALEVPLRVGVRRILESIPSHRLAAIRDRGLSASLRPGLPELLDYLDALGVPLVVVSGGVRVMVEAALGSLVRRTAGVYAVDLDASGPNLKVVSPFEGGTELVQKVAVMARHPASVRVAIGDSTTDLVMAQHAEVVFARDRLAGYLDERGVGYRTWTDFHDVRAQLAALWGGA